MIRFIGELRVKLTCEQTIKSETWRKRQCRGKPREQSNGGVDSWTKNLCPGRIGRGKACRKYGLTPLFVNLELFGLNSLVSIREKSVAPCISMHVSSKIQGYCPEFVEKCDSKTSFFGCKHFLRSMHSRNVQKVHERRVL